MNRLLVASMFLFTGQAVLADRTKIFEWRDAAGHTSYSNLAPPPDAKGVTSREIETRSFTPAQRIAIEAHLAHLEAAAQADSKHLQDRVDAADLAVNAALRRLTRAEHALRAGRRPQSSDRIGTAGGYSRLRVEYLDRLQLLEHAVQAAQTGVDETYRLRSAIMQ